MIHAKNGLIPIEDIEIGTEVLTQKGYYKVINKFDQGSQKLIRIHTQDGYFDCTENHRMAVMTGVDKFEWIEAKNLQAGDSLGTSRLAIKGCKQRLPEIPYEYCEINNNCKDIILPELDANIGWLIGVIQANGYIYINKGNSSGGDSVNIEFNNNDEEVLNKTIEQLKRFGVNPTIYKSKVQNSSRLSVYSKILARYFFIYVKTPKTEIEIPSFIKNSEVDIRLGYLAGLLDTDGSVKHTPVRLLTTQYESFMLEVQNLCYSCGIETRIDKYNTYDKCFNLNIISSYSKEILSNFSCKSLPIGNRDVYSNVYKQEWLFGYSHWNPSTSGGKNREVSVRRFSEITGIYPKILPVRILGFEILSEKQTYDIEVEEAHCFFANGYLTHNSAQIALFDPDDLECLLAKRWDLGNIPSHRAMSNNSVICNNLDDLHEFFWDTYNGNSEPLGLINLELSKKCGRLGETQYPDPNIQGYNP